MIDEIKNILQAYKPNNRQITNDTYAYKIRSLLESKIDLSNPYQVEQDLAGKTFKTKRSYYIAIVVYLKALGKDAKIYEEKVKQMGAEIETQDKKNEKSSDLVSEKEFKDIINNIEQNLETLDINSFKYYRKLQDYLIINLYFLIPPIRNDYILVDVYETIPIITSNDKNYISLNNKKLYLNRYKTDRKYGQITMDLPDKIIDIVRKMINKREELFPVLKSNHALLLNANRERMSKTNLIHNLNRIFKRKVSVTILRKSYVSQKYPVVNTVEEMENDARKMGHSVSMQQSTYRKRIE